MRYATGRSARISAAVTDALGNPVTDATTGFVLQRPDGTTVTYASPVVDGVGFYHQDCPASDLTQTGHYLWKTTATGAAAAGQLAFGDFDVFDPFEPAVLPLQDAKDALNIPQTTTTYDIELQQYIATIETSLERLTGGPIINRSVTERAEMMALQSVIVVRQRPLVSVTSIVSVASGTAIDISGGLDLDVNAGTVRRQFTGWPFILPTFVALPMVNITYVAGWGTAVPALFNTAGRIILQGLWETQHGPSARPQMGGGDKVAMPGFSFLISPQAAELLDGSVNGIPVMSEAYI